MTRSGEAMGLGMQIVYLGFSGSANIEAEAAVQLLRLEPFGGLLKSCHLAIESLHCEDNRAAYGVRLDLFMAPEELKPVVHCTDEDPLVAIRVVFEAAERTLQLAGAPRSARKDGHARRGH